MAPLGSVFRKYFPPFSFKTTDYWFVTGCEDPPFNSSSLGFEGVDTVGNPLNTYFKAFFTVKCQTGYFFAQEEFGDCRKFIAVTVIYCVESYL